MALLHCPGVSGDVYICYCCCPLSKFNLKNIQGYVDAKDDGVVAAAACICRVSAAGRRARAPRKSAAVVDVNNGMTMYENTQSCSIIKRLLLSIKPE